MRLTLEVVGTIDLDSGILNRNGVLDALERGKKWLARRGDIYGLLIVRFPVAQLDTLGRRDEIDFRKHVAAVIGAAIRDVDSVGRVDDHTFAAVLSDLNPGAIEIVANRLSDLVARLTKAEPAVGGVFRIGAVEVLSDDHVSGTVLERGEDLAGEAADNAMVLDRM